jgi:hypothetical protein
MRILLIAILVLSAATTFAQTKKFRWTTDMCEYESTYDAKKYTVAELENTRKLFFLDFFPNTIDPTPRSSEDIKKLRVETLDTEYKTRLHALKNLKIVKAAYWENLRQKHLRELEQVYLLSRATILSYENPTRLNDVKFSGFCAAKYAAPLIKGGDALLSVWRALNEESRQQNASPDAVRKKFEAQYNSPERLQFAKIEVTTYGWWNCVNALIDREGAQTEAEKEFRKLFTRTRTVECEQP